MSNELKARISLDTALLARGLQQSQTMVKGWAANLRSHIATAFSAAAITAAIRSTTDSLQGMGDAGDRMGRTVEEIQMLAQMAMLAGTELSKVENILTNISEAQIDALGGNTKKMDLFNKAGISAEQLNSTNEMGVLQMLARNLQGKNTSELRANLSDIIGKKNVGPFQAMQDDLADFQSKLQSAIQNSFVVSAEKITALKQATDELNLSIEQFSNSIKDTFLPIITLIIDTLHNMFIGIKMVFGGIAAFLGGFTSQMYAFKGGIGDFRKAFKDGFEQSMAVVDASVTEYSEKTKRKTDIRNKVNQKKENAEAGPNMDVPKKYFRFMVDKSVLKEKVNGPSAYNLYSATGGFAGSDMRMIQGVSIETNALLREQLKIQKKQLEEITKMALNRSADVLSLFGINF